MWTYACCSFIIIAMIQDFDYQNCIGPLLDWFDTHARVLPWRSDPSPYRVWISEIMLQQTRVEAVKYYFDRFLEALPDIASLAACPEDRLLKLWEGLGYYNRVRNLQAAARQIMDEYGGEMPADYEKLLRLKGIGRYTAGAVASIAFGLPVPAVDGNVLRVMTRLTADDTDVMQPAFRSRLEETISGIIPDKRAGSFNQALMELGATVCVPNGLPKCNECPWESFCLAHLAGRETEFPVKSAKKPRRREEKTVLVICDGARTVLRKRPAKGLLAGLYEFPSETGFLSPKEALLRAEALGFSPVYIQPLPDAGHIFTHVEWHMKGYLIKTAETESVPRGLILADKDEIETDYPMPSAFSKYTRILHIRLGKKEL